jgi:CobQ-like glutamine amidotransferase family enzyme
MVCTHNYNILTGKVVLELNLSVQVVGGSPSLSEGDTLSSVGILGLEVTNDNTRLVITETVDLEGLSAGKQYLAAHHFIALAIIHRYLPHRWGRWS